MDVLKLATEWARDEVFSTRFFILFGILFIAGTIGFWQLGKTDLAKAFIIPTLVAGALLLIIGFGLYFTNKSRITSFEIDHQKDATAFYQSELQRADKTIAEFQSVVFKAIPIIIVVAALLLIFVDRPLWRAISITTIAMMIVILLIDSNSSERMEQYKRQLEQVEAKD